MISDKSALSNTEEVGYTSTVKSAFETMKEGDYAGISLIFRIQPTRITKSCLSAAKDQAEICGTLDKSKSKVKKDSRCLPIRWKADSD